MFDDFLLKQICPHHNTVEPELLIFTWNQLWNGWLLLPYGVKKDPNNPVWGLTKLGTTPADMVRTFTYHIPRILEDQHCWKVRTFTYHSPKNDFWDPNIYREVVQFLMYCIEEWYRYLFQTIKGAKMLRGVIFILYIHFLQKCYICGRRV